MCQQKRSDPYLLCACKSRKKMEARGTLLLFPTALYGLGNYEASDISCCLPASRKLRVVSEMLREVPNALLLFPNKQPIRAEVCLCGLQIAKGPPQVLLGSFTVSTQASRQQHFESSLED